MKTAPLYRLLTFLLLASFLIAPVRASAAGSQAPTCTTPVTVTDSGDTDAPSTPGTLRWAVEEVCDGGTIGFSITDPIYLVNQIMITKNLTIDGSLTPGVSVHGGNMSSNSPRIFFVDPNAQATIRGLSLLEGYESEGGAIYNRGVLTVTNSTLTANSAAYDGGAIFNSGALTLDGATLANNSVNRFGGSIYNQGALTVTNSTLVTNTAAYDGGAIYNTIPMARAASAALAVPGEALIQGSRLNGNRASFYGGAIRNRGMLRLIDSQLSSNQAGYAGGALYNSYMGQAKSPDALAVNGQALVQGSTFTENFTIQGDGGAIASIDGSLYVTGSQFTGNTAGLGDGQEKGYGSGGAIANGYASLGKPAAPTVSPADFPFPSSYDLVLVNSLLFDNQATMGGGLSNGYGSTAVITTTRLISNSAEIGGGLISMGNETVVELYDSNLYGNQAQYEGGGLANWNGSNLAAVRSEIISNTVVGDAEGLGSAVGGGVSNSNGQIVVLANVTIANNRLLGVVPVEGYYGGAGFYHSVWSEGNPAAALLIHTTVSGNQVADSSMDAASGVWVDFGPMTVTNSIIAGNGANGLGNFLVDGQGGAVLASGGGNLTNSSGGLLTQTGDQEGVDPGLAPLWQFAANRWILPLKPAALAMNAALAAPCAAWPVSSRDQRGNPRPVGAGCDSGAYEASGYTLSILGGDNQSTLINTSFANPLVVQVASNTPGEPLDGLRVRFTQPAAGASATLSGGSLPVTVTLDSNGRAAVNAAANGITGSYLVTATLQGATLPANPVSFHLTNLPPSVDLAAAVTARWDPVLIGATNYLTLTVHNQGGYPAPSVVVTNTLPAGTTLMTVSDPACTSSGQQLVCALGDLAAGASRSVALRIRLSAAIPDQTTLVDQVVATSALSDPNPANNSATVDFLAVIELLVYRLGGNPGSEWGSDAHLATPACGAAFLGEFTNQTVTLTVTGLQTEHYYARSVFDLYILRSWDGNQVDNTLPAHLRARSPESIVGPDRWRYTFGGQSMLDTTFTNWKNSLFNYNQAFPGPVGSSNPAQTGAKAVNSLCYNFEGYEMDATYGLASFIPQDSETVQLSFTAQGLQPIEDESWGLGGLSVYIRALPMRQVYLYLPVMQ